MYFSVRESNRDKMDEDAVTREFNIKHNLESYLPYICECVDSTHLLIYLDCFTGGR